MEEVRVALWGLNPREKATGKTKPNAKYLKS